MNLATLIGLVMCFGLMMFGIVSGDQGFAAVSNFVDPASIFITFGGAFGATLTMHSMQDFINGLKGFSIILKEKKMDHAATITQIIELSNLARKEGLLALEESASNVDDEFLKKGVLLIVDGTEPDLVRAILETELMNLEARHKKVYSFWENLAGMGPAWGMIGTLIGLINMLQNMNDPSAIGPNMSTALVTTLYGSLLANWIATPCAIKLRAINATEITMKEVMIEGLLSIQAGENPRVIAEKLKSFLAPAERAKLGEEGEGGQAGEA